MKTNFQTYNSPEIVLEYSNASGLFPAETILFEKYVGAPSVILDLGVGGGRTTPLLSGIGSKYIGIDYSPAMIEECQRKFPSLEFRIADVSDLSPLEDCSIDVVVFSFNGIDYLETDEARHRCFREVARVLRPDGVFLFSSHHARALAHWPNFSGARIHQIIWRSVLGTIKAINSTSKAIFRSSFYSGQGYLLDPVHGGLWTYVSCPAVIARQAANCGFHVVEVIPGHYPQISASAFTHWFYYCLRRKSNLSHSA